MPRTVGNHPNVCRTNIENVGDMVIAYHEVTTYTYIEREGPPPQCMHIDFTKNIPTDMYRSASVLQIGTPYLPTSRSKMPTKRRMS